MRVVQVPIPGHVYIYLIDPHSEPCANALGNHIMVCAQ